MLNVKCEILNVKSPKKNKLDDDFAKKLGAKNLQDLTEKLKKQIADQYNMALNSISKYYACLDFGGYRECQFFLLLMV